MEVDPQEEFERLKQAVIVIRGKPHTIDVNKVGLELTSIYEQYGNSDIVGQLAAVAEWMNREFNLSDVTTAEAELFAVRIVHVYEKLKKNMDAIVSSFTSTI